MPTINNRPNVRPSTGADQTTGTNDASRFSRADDIRMQEVPAPIPQERMAEYIAGIDELWVGGAPTDEVLAETALTLLRSDSPSQTIQDMITAAGVPATDATDTAAPTAPNTPSKAEQDLLASGSAVNPAVGQRPPGAADPRLGGGVPQMGLSTRSANPTGAPVLLDTDAVQLADDALNLETINKTFNPMLGTLTGLFENPSEMYETKVGWPAQQAVGGLLQVMGTLPQFETLMTGVDANAILGKMNENLVTRGTGQQFVDSAGKIGNNVTLYGGDRGHSDIDKVIGELGDKGMRALKVMSHIDKKGQGGTMDQVLGDGVGGVTHTGGFSSGMVDGEQMSIRSDWPANYGSMSDNNVSYNAIVVAVDYNAGTKGELSVQDMKAYKQNADMWDVFAAAIPFASGDRDSRYGNYMYNPLEAHSKESLTSIAEALSSVDPDVMLKEHGAFYCAEGQYTVASLGPNDATLLKESEFGDTRAGKMIKAFQNTPGMTQEELKASPNKGWEHLLTLDASEGGINQDEYTALKQTDRLGTYLEFIPETQEGWEKADPINEEGLVAKPMTIATMAWGLLRGYMPIDRLGADTATELTRVYNEGGPEAQEALNRLVGNPNTVAGQARLERLGEAAGSLMLINVLGSPDFKDRMLDKSGYKEITNDADKEKYSAMYDKFVETMKGLTVNGADQATRDATIMALDDEFRNLSVERHVRIFNETTGEDEYLGKKTGPMLYASPFANIAYTQNPELHQSSLRYVTNLQHVQQSEAPPTAPTLATTLEPARLAELSEQVDAIWDRSPSDATRHEDMILFLRASPELFPDGAPSDSDLIATAERLLAPGDRASQRIAAIEVGGPGAGGPSNMIGPDNR